MSILKMNKDMTVLELERSPVANVETEGHVTTLYFKANKLGEEYYVTLTDDEVEAIIESYLAK